jgi:hypothetical protein
MADAKKRPNMKNVWREARRLVWEHRFRLAFGLSLMLVNRDDGH